MAGVDVQQGYRVLTPNPADAKYLIADEAARFAFPPTPAYPGMLVYQQSDNTLWRLVTVANIGSNAGWTQVPLDASLLATLAGSQTFTGTNRFDEDIIGDLRGDVNATDGTTVLDSGTDGTNATFTGDVTGDLTGTADQSDTITDQNDAANPKRVSVHDSATSLPASADRDSETIYIVGGPTPTTTDVPEGTNLYYTDERAQAAVGGAVSTWARQGNTDEIPVNKIPRIEIGNTFRIDRTAEDAETQEEALLAAIADINALTTDTFQNQEYLNTGDNVTIIFNDSGNADEVASETFLYASDDRAELVFADIGVDTSQDVGTSDSLHFGPGENIGALTNNTGFTLTSYTNETADELIIAIPDGVTFDATNNTINDADGNAITSLSLRVFAVDASNEKTGDPVLVYEGVSFSAVVEADAQLPTGTGAVLVIPIVATATQTIQEVLAALEAVSPLFDSGARDYDYLTDNQVELYLSDTIPEIFLEEDDLIRISSQGITTTFSDNLDGLVPAPNDQNPAQRRFLAEDGTWVYIPIAGGQSIPINSFTSSGFTTDQFTSISQTYTLIANWTVESGALFTGGTITDNRTSTTHTIPGTANGTFTTPSISRTFGNNITYTLTLNGTDAVGDAITVTQTRTLTASKTNPGNPTVRVTRTGFTVSNEAQRSTTNQLFEQIERHDTGSLAFTHSLGSANSWNTDGAVQFTNDGGTALTGNAVVIASPGLTSGNSITVTQDYIQPSGTQTPTVTLDATYNYDPIISLRYGTTTQTAFTNDTNAATGIQNLSLFTTMGTIDFENDTQNDINGSEFTVTTTEGQRIYIVTGATISNFTIIRNTGSLQNDVGVFTVNTIGSYKYYLSEPLGAGTITYNLTI